MNRPVIDHFLSLCAVPRPSHHEEQISSFLYRWGLDRGLKSFRDEEGNVILEKSASPGLEGAPVTILQAHMDMVVVWNEGVAHDPLRDPVRPVVHNGVITAEGTSLGGDDGAGVAIAMAILDDPNAVHGPLRAIFTVDEEDGMSGANALDPRFAEGSYLINLDWEEFDSLCCSSAGSDMYALRRAAAPSPAEGTAYELVLRGLEGGHSGTSIHLGRGNAIRLAADILRAARREGIALRLVSFTGGSAHNAIPAKANAVFIVPAGQEERFRAVSAARIDALMESLLVTDPHAVLALQQTGAPTSAFSEADTDALLDLVCEVHDGVNTMSRSIPGLVESSANLGLIRTGDAGFEFVIHQRSSDPGITASMREEYLRQAASRGFTLTVLSSGAAWPVREGSRLVELYCRLYEARFGKAPKVCPVHAGLECGSFSAKNRALDIISIGPEIRDIHSPKETLVIDTVLACEDLVRDVLRAVAEEA